MDNNNIGYNCSYTFNHGVFMETLDPRLKEELFNRFKQLTELEQIRYGVIVLQHAALHVTNTDHSDKIKFLSNLTLMRLQIAATSEIFKKDKKLLVELNEIGKIVAGVSDTINKVETPSWTPPVHNDVGDEYNQ